jgi:hypothetical protein
MGSVNVTLQVEEDGSVGANRWRGRGSRSREEGSVRLEWDGPILGSGRPPIEDQGTVLESVGIPYKSPYKSSECAEVAVSCACDGITTGVSFRGGTEGGVLGMLTLNLGGDVDCWGVEGGGADC